MGSAVLDPGQKGPGGSVAKSRPTVAGGGVLSKGCLSGLGKVSRLHAGATDQDKSGLVCSAVQTFCLGWWLGPGQKGGSEAGSN